VDEPRPQYRPMAPADVTSVAQLQSDAGTDLMSRLGLSSEATPSEGSASRERDLISRFVTLDGPGCWVAESGTGDLVGCSIGIRRDAFFGLCSLFVRPGLQTHGVGRRLLDLALDYGTPAPVGMIMASPDFRAIRRYAMAGFDLHPAVQVEGLVDKRSVPAVGNVRDGDLSDLDLVDAVDRRVMNRSRAADAEFLLSDGGRLAVVDQARSRGFAVFRDGAPAVDGYPMFLAATDEPTAARLLWYVFGESTRPVLAWHWTRQQSWAVKVANVARLRVTPTGPLFLRGLSEPHGPWLPSAYFF